MKFITAFVILMSVQALAGGFGTVNCSACKYSAPAMTGGTKTDAKNGVTRATFFCKTTKKFLVMSVPIQATQEKHLATETPKLVDPKLPFHIFTSDTCKNSLIPVDYYVKSGVPCPVCGKGTVTVSNDGFMD